MGWWNDLWVKKSNDWIFARLDPQQTPGGKPTELVGEDAGYISVTLKSMRVVNLRKGLSKFYGTINSYITLAQPSQESGKVNTIVTPNELKKVDAAHLDRVISMNHRLLGPMPYRGGDMTVEIGLFSIKESDLVGPFLDTLESLANVAGVGYIKAAMPFVEPIKKGFEYLTGSGDDSVLEIGLHRTFLHIETGYYVVIGGPKGSIDLKALRLDPNDFKLTGPDEALLREYPYFVIEISSEPTRTDWQMLPELKERYDALKELLRTGKDAEAKEALVAMGRFLKTSKDLLFQDAKKIFASIEEKANDIMGIETTRGEKSSKSLPELNELKVF
jgi:hypothetical protein